MLHKPAGIRRLVPERIPDDKTSSDDGCRKPLSPAYRHRPLSVPSLYPDARKRSRGGSATPPDYHPILKHEHNTLQLASIRSIDRMPFPAYRAGPHFREKQQSVAYMLPLLQPINLAS